MLYYKVFTLPEKKFQELYSIQAQLDSMREALLNQPNAIEELKKMEEARYGHSTS